MEEAYIHCAKAVRRGNVWDPASWPDTSDMPTPAAMLRDHAQLDGSVSVEQLTAALDEKNDRSMWLPGGAE